ncbi:MerR family transcriptional regulator [Streptomyces bambusae]|uniref:MerR family transcriptional regulator n=2 Tax=Streptomyces bambusae TaxID=1550616 RepID=A0ABS6YZ16_9ACTN|nr:MerR family transcriptional regulator [Streptomyces bambusae]
MRTIGETARDSGLGVSALRFYDRSGVLVPARVDPVTGYRWYGPGQVDEARLLARLRRTGMPLADIRLVLAGWSGPDTGLVRQLLDAHLRRLERGLAEARGEFSTVRSLLDRKEKPMTSPRTVHAQVSVPADGLAAALDAVRFAVSADPELPALGGVLFDLEGESLYLVATDRYRMAVAQTEAAGHDGPRTQVVVPAPLADAMRALLAGAGTARLTVDGDRVVLEAGDRQTAGTCPGHDFPDHRRLLALPEGRRGAVDVAAFAAQEDELSVLTVADGDVVLGGAGPERVAVNRAYLLEACAALASDRLLIELGAPTAPVTIRHPDTAKAYSILMPVRLDD